MDCVRVLLRANADPLLTRAMPLVRRSNPLDAAAQNGHASVVRELIPHFGNEAVGGGKSVGVNALSEAAKDGHVDVMTVLTDAGVVDTSTALCGAAAFGNEASISFLLQQEHKGKRTRERLYANSVDEDGMSALFHCVLFCRSCSPRIARLLIDAGADPVLGMRDKDATGPILFTDTPLAMALKYLREKKIRGKDASEEQLNALEATRRLLLRVDAVRATSWVWPNHVSAITGPAGVSKRVSMTSTIQSPLSRTLPTFRLRAARQRAPWAALRRWAVCCEIEERCLACWVCLRLCFLVQLTF